MPLPTRKCPCCGGADLQPGSFGMIRQPFQLKGSKNKWEPTATACLDCGFVCYFLGDVAVNSMRKHVAKNRLDEVQ